MPLACCRPSAASRRAEQLAAELRKSQGGHNLIGLGLDDDILAAAQLDRFDIVPRLDPKDRADSTGGLPSLRASGLAEPGCCRAAWLS